MRKTFLGRLKGLEFMDLAGYAVGVEGVGISFWIRPSRKIERASLQ